MLRREQTESSEADAAPYAGVDRRRHPRVKMEDADSSGGRRKSDHAGEERRSQHRRSTDAIRAKLQQAPPPSAKTGLFGGIGQRAPRRTGMKPARMALLLVAMIAGGLAAFMSTQSETQSVASISPIPTKIVREARAQVLVANEAIGLGQRLSTSSIAWEDWPEGAVRDDYITVSAAPEAMTQMVGAVARYEFFPGEPIREQKLAQSDQGYLSAILGNGLRGVSVSIAAESASGGFIVPNDHVDVIATRATDFGQSSETILQNVRVLAINSRLGETGKTGEPTDLNNPRAEIFSDLAIATLELNTTQAELIITAAAGGQLSLVLLSITDFADSDDVRQHSANAAIRMTSPFWKN